MKNIHSIILVLLFMTILIIEKSTCFEIMVVAILLGILQELIKNENK